MDKQDIIPEHNTELDIQLEEIKNQVEKIAFFKYPVDIMKKASIYSLESKDVVELKEPFTIGGQLFKFSNHITTEDWLIIMNSFQNSFVKTALQNKQNLDTPSFLVVDIIQDMAFKYLIHVDKDTKAELKVDRNNLSDLVNYSPEVVLIPRYFFQKMLFTISKSSLHT